ncbi:MAG TPA: hypothetical protein VKE88_01230 [Candidatus Nanoarchaeia archaeon]|nr:hypothetical protein [Candidatus Nanoarchaeia archaeon]
MNLLKKLGLVSLVATGCASLDENPRYHEYLIQTDRDNPQTIIDRPKALLIYSQKDMPLFANKFDTAKRNALKEQYNLKTVVAKDEIALYGAIIHEGDSPLIGLAGSFTKDGMTLGDCFAETCAFTLPEDVKALDVIRGSLAKDTSFRLYVPNGQSAVHAHQFANTLRTQLKRNIVVK